MRRQLFRKDSLLSAGITIKKTNTALVIGIYDQSVAAGDANVVVENMGDYLIEQGM